MRTLNELMLPSLKPVAPAPIASLRSFMAGRRAVGVIGAMLVVPPAVLCVLFLAEPDADGRGWRDAWEQALMAASVLFVLVAHACALLVLLREQRSNRRAGASKR
jgi:hypothetical protein